jgi:hypothetical protein
MTQPHWHSNLEGRQPYVAESSSFTGHTTHQQSLSSRQWMPGWFQPASCHAVLHAVQQQHEWARCAVLCSSSSSSSMLVHICATQPNNRDLKPPTDQTIWGTPWSSRDVSVSWCLPSSCCMSAVCPSVVQKLPTDGVRHEDGLKLLMCHFLLPAIIDCESPYL